MEFIRDQPRRKAVHGGAARVAWGRRHDFCAACGAREYGLHVLTTHEIIGGQGGRSQEPCNWLRLGWHACHQLASGLDVRGPAWTHRTMGRIPGDLLPKITLGIALSMKLRCDPDEVDWDRLQELRGSRLPDPEDIPRHFVDLYRRNRQETN